ncbi:MAG: 4-hydroxythreonine-4-phosphate dehydrogenase PdxA [Gemmobacter sp.]
MPVPDTDLPVAVSCGEPAGIGPELALRARARLGAALPFVWIGDPRHLPPGSPLREVDSPEAALSVPATHLPVLPIDIGPAPRPGRPDPALAAGVVRAIARAVELVQAGRASALTTLPIHKKVLQDGAGFAFPGHTEYLASLAGVAHVAMMLACDALRVVPATIHIALARVPAALTDALIETTIRLTVAGLQRDFGIPAPRIAVAGLNPHAGEGGAFGTEEVTRIGPLLDRLRAQGLTLAGPLSADTMFHPAARATYDAAVCMYHDQALIPIKTLDFAGGVNVTLGLPFVRTSPDHGTAFDIAGRGIADETSTVAALRLAARLAARRKGQG